MTDPKNLSTHEPPPRRTEGPAIWSLVIQDMQIRDVEGRRRYGTPLQAFNGRDAIMDLYQELLDAAVYVRQAIHERDSERDMLCSELTDGFLESWVRAGDARCRDGVPTDPISVAAKNLKLVAAELLERRRTLKPPREWNQAKRLSRDAWQRRLAQHGTDVSVTDAFTDGFQEGILWRQQQGPHRRLARIAEIIEQVDHRAMAADGPVTPTLQEMRQEEISEIYGLATGGLVMREDLDGFGEDSE